MLAKGYAALYKLPRQLYCGLAGTFVIALFVLGAMPSVVAQLPSPIANMDKAYHVAAYAVFTAFLWFGLKAPRFWLALALVSATGLADELHQATLSFRTAGVDDWLADILAGLVTLVCLRALHARALASPFCTEALHMRRLAN